MANTTANLNNINFLTKTQYDSIETPADNELYAVDVATAADFVNQLGFTWTDAGANGGQGACMSLPYGDSHRLKIQIYSETSSASSFTWTYPVAFEYFCMVVSNGNVLLSNKTLSNVVVTDNNYGDSSKHSAIDLIAIGI